MAHSPSLITFLRQVTGDASGGVVGLLTNIPLFKAAFLEAAHVVFEEEGAEVVQTNVANFTGAGVTVTEDPDGVAKIDIPGGGGGGGVIHITHELPPATNAPATVTGIWQLRPLNTVNKNTIVGASLAADQITLPAGDYHIRAWQTVFDPTGAQTRLRDITGAATLVLGGVIFASGSSQSWELHLDGYFTLAAESDLEFQLFPRVGVGAGMGVRVNPSDGEDGVFAMIQIEEV